MDSTKLPLSSLRIDGGTQQRVAIDTQVVHDYSELLQDADFDFPPISVISDSTNNFVVDGIHRFFAYQEACRDVIPAYIKAGTQEQAQWESCAVNANHGLRRTKEDRQKAVLTAIQLRPLATVREISEHCKVSKSHVQRIMQEQVKPEPPVPTSRPPVPPPMPKQTAVSTATLPMPSSPPMPPPIPLPPPKITDAVGNEIPPEVLSVWQERNKYNEILHCFVEAEQLLKEYSALQVFSGTDINMLLLAIGNCKRELRMTEPYVVCPYCQGLLNETCKPCKGRGFMGKHLYQTCVPGELKKCN